MLLNSHIYFRSYIFGTMIKGLVLKSTGSWYRVLPENGDEVDARLKGKIRLQGLRTTNPVAVGDKVNMEEVEDGTYVISSIDPRFNCIVRKSTNLSKASHILAANLDQAILLVTVQHPVTSNGFIDRFLVSAESFQIPTIIVFNKVDLYDEKGKERLADLVAIYDEIGYETHQISALEAQDVEKMKPLFQGKTTILSGHSGSGKSTLSNSLQPGLNLRIGDISDSHHKGKHTTTFAEMHPLAMGGYIVDTPGIKGFGLSGIDKEELNHYFPEFKNLLGDCKFYNCKHLNEPKCAVMSAVEQGDVSVARYESYLALMNDDESSYR